MVGEPQVVIVASAFGIDAIRADGHLKWAQASRRAGAAGFEVRRELLRDDADAAAPRLRALGDAIADLGLWTVYSTPASLFSDAGRLDADALGTALDEAAALGARIVKLQLGGYRPAASDATRNADDLARVAAALAGRSGCSASAHARLVVENGQLEQGGKPAQFVALFDALARAGHAGLAGMTFDTGNWAWAGVEPLDAARELAPHVEYIHCKTTAGTGARRFAAAPAADDAHFRAVLDSLPRTVPRAIEFPFDRQRVDADAAHYVKWLAAA